MQYLEVREKGIVNIPMSDWYVLNTIYSFLFFKDAVVYGSSLCPQCIMLLAMLLNAQDFNLHTYYDNVQTSHTFFEFYKTH